MPDAPTSDQRARIRIGLYPGTFDPITNGHIDIISRAARICDRLVIGVAANIGKGPMFSLPERVELVQAECSGIAARTGTAIEVRDFQGLLIAFAHQIGAGMVIRGLRAVTDFDYEFMMAGMNARLDSSVETVFLMASERHQFISSRFVKEIALLGGDVSSFVPPLALERTLARVRSA
jgi:pantetheine-phosphate adenylyltransferase